MNTGTNYYAKYFKLTKGLDMNCQNYKFTPIGYSSSKSFQGNFDGNNQSISNLDIVNQGTNSINYGGLFGYIKSYLNRGSINNLHIDFNLSQETYSYNYFGGLSGYISNTDYNKVASITNIHVTFTGKYNTTFTSTYYVGGLAGQSSYVDIANCSVSGFTFSGPANSVGGIVGQFTGGRYLTDCHSINMIIDGATKSGTNLGGVVGYATGNIQRCTSDANIKCVNTSATIGGIVGTSELNIFECVFVGEVDIELSSSGCVGGILGEGASSSYPQLSLMNNLYQGHITVIDKKQNGAVHTGGIVARVSNTSYEPLVKYNIVNGMINSNSVSGGINGCNDIVNDNVFNEELFISNNATTYISCAVTSEDLKSASTYENWEDFDVNWIIDENVNDSYPMLRSYLGQSKQILFSGSGTSTDPYIINTKTDMDNLSKFYNYGGAVDNVVRYWKLEKDIDMQGNEQEFTPIGVILPFNGSFDGNGHTLTNLKLNSDYQYSGLFGQARSNSTSNPYIKNINLEIIPTKINNSLCYGGLVAESSYYDIRNVNINYQNGKMVIQKFYSRINVYIAGLVGNATSTNVYSSTVSNFNLNIDADLTSASYGICIGGLMGANGKVYSSKIVSNLNINASGKITQLYIGGIGGYSVSVESSMFTGNIYVKLVSTKTTDTNDRVFVGGVRGYSSSGGIVWYSLFQGKITFINNGNNSSNIPMIAGISNGTNTKWSISNGEINCSGSAEYNVSGSSPTDTTNTNNAYNADKYDVGENYNTNVTTYALTNVELAEESSYDAWGTRFKSFWTMDDKLNGGYPIPSALVEYADVTGFSGSGTSTSPYQIKTKKDLLGFANIYNGDAVVKSNLYWKLYNDIDISKTVSNQQLHFETICFNKPFDGYFDGNGKTISGLLIDNQYEYTGLFGTIASNHWVKDLTVKGDIYWDEAYAVGGVAGRILAGGYLQYCHFEGNIIGVLNTKTSTETNGVVGKFEINGAIDCTATYTDIKYAKIGGTADNPTYTYYLYDWAQIKTYLYDKAVA